MRWQGRRQSDNIEDRRGSGTGRRMGLPMGRSAGAGVGGLGLVAVIVLALAFGIDPTVLLTGLEPGGGVVIDQGSERPVPGEDDEVRAFTAVILADTEDAWHRIFQSEGSVYEEPRLVLFSGAVQSACGFAESAVGPFYCPGDRKVYIDLAFFEDLAVRFKAPGDFAQAYVIAHEVGHHVQTLLGISPKVRSAQAKLARDEANALSVRQELQADCLAGLWAHHTERHKNVLDEGDIEEGLAAASAIGDDRLQRQARGYVSPESFTHGTSEQRARWFRRGLEIGTLAACDTFAATTL